MTDATNDLKAALGRVNEGKANPIADFTKPNTPPTPNSNPPSVEAPTSDSQIIPPNSKDTPSTITSKTPDMKVGDFTPHHDPQHPAKEGDKSIKQVGNRVEGGTTLDSRTANLIDEARKSNKDKPAEVRTNKRELIANVLRNNGMDSMQQMKALADIMKILEDMV